MDTCSIGCCDRPIAIKWLGMCASHFDRLRRGHAVFIPIRGPQQTERRCWECGVVFTVYRAWIRGGKAAKYCSRSCAGKGKKTFSRPKNYRVKKECEVCKTEFIVKRYRVSGARYCSNKCRWFGHGSLIGGPRHPFWKGGISKRPSKVATIINRVKIKTPFCEMCGSTKFLQGHHAKHYSTNPEDRTNVDNIIVLCADCHAKEHPRYANFILSHKQKTKRKSYVSLAKKGHKSETYRILHTNYEGDLHPTS